MKTRRLRKDFWSDILINCKDIGMSFLVIGGIVFVIGGMIVGGVRITGKDVDNPFMQSIWSAIWGYGIWIILGMIALWFLWNTGKDFCNWATEEIPSERFKQTIDGYEKIDD